MPWQILLALLTASLLWGWVDVAGLLALAWGGLARIGEVFAAYRRDLVLPSDVQQTVDYILLAIREPKTRNTAARHQALRLDQPQLMRVVELAFRKRHRLQKLWLYSPGTFRVRFAKRVEALQLDQLKDRNVRPLDLGSLRAGGATWLLQATENGEFVRRRGRWLNSKIMEIYIQEVSSVLFLSRLRGDVANNVLEVMRLFPHMLEQAEIFTQYGFLPTTWFSLLPLVGLRERVVWVRWAEAVACAKRAVTTLEEQRKMCATTCASVEPEALTDKAEGVYTMRARSIPPLSPANQRQWHAQSAL